MDEQEEKEEEKKGRREEEKKNLQISADVTKKIEEEEAGGGTRKRKEQESTRMCINEKLGNNPLARDQRFHVTRKDHLNPEAPTIRGGFNSSNRTIDVARDRRDRCSLSRCNRAQGRAFLVSVDKSGSESACIFGASTSGRFRSRSIGKEGRKEERGVEKGGE